MMTGSPASPAITISVPFDIGTLDWTDDGAHLVVGATSPATGLAKVDATTGGMAWNVSLSAWCQCHQAVGPNVVLQIGGGAMGVIAGHDLGTGKQIWRRGDLTVQVVGIDPAGEWVAAVTGGQTGGPSILILDTTDGKTVAQYAQPVNYFVGGGYAPGFISGSTSERLAVATETGVAVVNPKAGAALYPETGSALFTVPTASDVRTMAFADDGATLTIVETNGQVTVVDGGSGSQISRCNVEEPTGKFAVLSPDRRVVALAGDLSAAMYLVSTGRCLGTVTWDPGNVSIIFDSDQPPPAFSPDARWIAMVTAIYGTPHGILGGGEAKLAAAPVPSLMAEFPDAYVRAVVFNRTGERLAIVPGPLQQGTGLIEVYATGPMTEIAVGSAQSPVQVIGVDVTGRGIKLAAGIFSDQHARLYDAEDGTLKYDRLHPGNLTDIAFVMNGDGFVTAGTDGVATRWGTGSGLPAWTVQHAGPVNALACSPAGDMVCTASQDKTVRCLDAVTGNERWRTALPQGVKRVAVSPDASFVVAAAADRAAYVLAMTDGTERWHVTHGGPILGLAVSPDHAWVATASLDGLVRVLASDTGALLRTVSHVSGATSVVFTADNQDNQSVISGSQDGAVLMSSLADPGAAPVPLAHFQVPVTKLTTCGTEPSVAVAGHKMVRILDYSLRAELARFSHDAPVSDIAADPVSRLLATGASDGGIRVYPWPGQ